MSNRAVIIAIALAAAGLALGLFGWLARQDSAIGRLATGEMAAFTISAGGPPAPEITFRDGTGAPLTLRDFRGRVVLVNLWATWCAPCVKEMPALDRLEAELGGGGFTVLAVSLDRDGLDAINPFFERHGLAHLGRYTGETAALFRAFGVRGLPMSILIDAEGREIGRLEGAAEWDSQDAIRLIRHVKETTR
jgi:thiol-disulfide isomerase/thioredoxin